MNEVVISAKNNTAEVQQVNLFQYANLADNANATTRYSYDLTGYSLNEVTSVTLSVKTAGETEYTPYFAELIGQQTIQGIADTLTSLGFGTWFVDGNTLNLNTNQVIIGDVDIIYIPPP